MRSKAIEVASEAADPVERLVDLALVYSIISQVQEACFLKGVIDENGDGLAGIRRIIEQGAEIDDWDRRRRTHCDN